MSLNGYFYYEHHHHINEPFVKKIEDIQHEPLHYEDPKVNIDDEV